MIARIVLALVFALPLAAGAEVAAPAAAPVATPGPAPDVLIRQSAQEMLKDIDANRAVYRKDPDKVRALVDRVLLPHFDTDYSARLVLGKHWRTATPEQRQRFVDAFYKSLLRNYGAALTDFTADRLIFLPFKGDPASNQATVRTEVRRDNGARVPVNYSLHRTAQGWKAWDVTIEGISYVRNFRADFATEIDQKGLDEVIARLEADLKKPAESRPAASGRGGV